MIIECKYNKIKNKGTIKSNISEWLFSEDIAPYFRFYSSIEGKRYQVATYEQAISNCNNKEDVEELMKECVRIGLFGCIIDW